MTAYLNKEATEEETKAEIANILVQKGAIKGDADAAAAKIFETFATKNLTKATWK
jgi:hypothetical protein